MWEAAVGSSSSLNASRVHFREKERLVGGAGDKCEPREPLSEDEGEMREKENDTVERERESKELWGANLR